MQKTLGYLYEMQNPYAEHTVKSLDEIKQNPSEWKAIELLHNDWLYYWANSTHTHFGHFGEEIVKKTIASYAPHCPILHIRMPNIHHLFFIALCVLLAGAMAKI